MSELEKLYALYAPRQFELGGLNNVEEEANPTNLPVVPQARLNMREEAPQQNVQALSNKYDGFDQNAMMQDYMAARKEARAQNDLLRQSLEKHLTGEPVDKSEMYFRLAAALASPTHTQGIGEPMTRAAEALAAGRASERAQNQANALAALKARQGMAELAGTEAKDIGELMAKYAKGNTAQSSAGKYATDLGYKPNTPEYVNAMKEYFKLSNSVNPVQLANLDISQQRLILDKQKAEQEAAEKARKATKLSPTELKMKSEQTDIMNSLNEMENQLSQAWTLSKKAFDTSLPDIAQRKALELSGSENQKLTDTQELEKILGGQTLAEGQRMKGTLSDSDIKLLSSLSGATSKSKAGRNRIILQSIAAIRRAKERALDQLKSIESGDYSTYTPEEQ